MLEGKRKQEGQLMDLSPALDINELVSQLNKGALINDTQLDAVLKKLQDFECWSLYFRLLEAQIDNPKKRQLQHYVQTAQAYAIHLEDINKAAKICVKLLKDLKLNYWQFRENALHAIVGEQEYEQEAIILQASLPRLRSKEDSVACLERLCLIYEKKKFDENMLNKSYEKLIELEPNNLKALRYFKVVYTQNNQWDRVVQVLQSLFQNAKHVNDRYRSAQELATVYLYQLDQAQNAIEIIEKYCAESPLNTFTIHYEAYYRLQNWDGCLRVLKGHLKRADSSLNRAIILLKIGELEEQLSRHDDAEQSFLQCLELDSTMLEPLENLIEMNIENQKWDKVLHHLSQLGDLMDDTYLKDKVREARSRLLEALEGSKTKEAN